MNDKKVADTVENSVTAEGKHPLENNLMAPIPHTDEYIKQIMEENDRIVEEELAELKKKAHSPSCFKTFTALELLDKYFENKPFIIDTLLDPGVYILAGAPKLGKSFLSLQIACHVSTGDELWDCKVRQGTVYYLALEDTDERLQRRLYRMAYVQNQNQSPDYNKLILTTEDHTVKSCYRLG